MESVRDSAARWPQGSLKVLRHLACIAALMWTALINGQPFFFPDTTSYVRAADIAIYMASGHRISTDWTARYSDDIQHGAARPDAAAPRRPIPGNDVASGQIMTGRSPYIGAILYLAYVASNFWLFVIAQAALAYWLIRLALRRFGIDRENTIAGVVVLLAATTSLPYFNSLLLADALAGFGILAFLLLAADDGRLRRRERIGLVLILIMSAISHLTHVLMLLSMVAVLALWQVRRRVPRQGWALAIGSVTIVIGLLSTMLTSYVVTQVFQRPPQLVPLMTARFIGDGPGADFVRAGCPGADFAVCHFRMNATSAEAFLWSTDPAIDGFTTATPAQRQRLSAEDTAFALATLKAYPLRQTGMMVYNSVAQMLTFPYDGLNTGCWDQPDCWTALPAPTRDTLQHSLSGRNLWPSRLMTWLQYGAVALSVVIVAVCWPRLRRSAPTLAATMLLWLTLAFVAMGTCDVLGGAISAPQYRYQGRLVWLAVLFAAIIMLAERRNRQGVTTASP